MNTIDTVVAILSVLALVISIAALLASPSHGAGYRCIAILWSAGWLIVLLRSRRRARPRSSQPPPGSTP